MTTPRMSRWHAMSEAASREEARKRRAGYRAQKATKKLKTVIDTHYPITVINKDTILEQLAELSITIPHITVPYYYKDDNGDKQTGKIVTIDYYNTTTSTFNKMMFELVKLTSDNKFLIPIDGVPVKSSEHALLSEPLTVETPTKISFAQTLVPPDADSTAKNLYLGIRPSNAIYSTLHDVDGKVVKESDPLPLIIDKNDLLKDVYRLMPYLLYMQKQYTNLLSPVITEYTEKIVDNGDDHFNQYLQEIKDLFTSYSTRAMNMSTEDMTGYDDRDATHKIITLSNDSGIVLDKYKCQIMSTTVDYVGNNLITENTLLGNSRGQRHALPITKLRNVTLMLRLHSSTAQYINSDTVIVLKIEKDSKYILYRISTPTSQITEESELKVYPAVEGVLNDDTIRTEQNGVIIYNNSNIYNETAYVDTIFTTAGIYKYTFYKLDNMTRSQFETAINSTYTISLPAFYSSLNMTKIHQFILRAKAQHILTTDAEQITVPKYHRANTTSVPLLINDKYLEEKINLGAAIQ